MGWGALEEFGALFNPGMRHEQERRRQLDVLRDDEGNAADPPSTVDLDAGVAVIRLPRAQAERPERDPRPPSHPRRGSDRRRRGEGE